MADQKNQERCQEVDDYIAGFEAPVRERLEAVRSLVLGDCRRNAARSSRRGAPQRTT